MSDRTLKLNDKNELVKTLQILLNQVLVPSPNLPGGTKFGQQTQQAVIRFQTEYGLARKDGVVDADTWKALRRQLGENMEQVHLLSKKFKGTLFTMPSWLANIGGPKSYKIANIEFDRSTFFEMFVEEFGAADSGALQGLDLLLGFFEEDPDVTDVRIFAYMLATVKVECGDTWRPIHERGPIEYFEKYEGKLGNTDDGDGYKYRGRGYVQITGKGNYSKLGKRLGKGDDLVKDPDAVLESYIAYRIMTVGMREGLFTGKKIGEYVNDAGADYKGARRVINAQDRAQEIAGYASKFEAILNASLKIVPIPLPTYRLAFP